MMSGSCSTRRWTRTASSSVPNHQEVTSMGITGTTVGWFALAALALYLLRRAGRKEQRDHASNPDE